MTDSQADIIAIILGLAVFAIIVTVGWRSVQNRRILRLKGASGQETIIVANEDDDVTSIDSSDVAGPTAEATVKEQADVESRRHSTSG